MTSPGSIRKYASYALLIFSTACGQDGTATGVAAQIDPASGSESRDPLYYHINDFTTYETRRIPVCWEPLASTDPASAGNPTLRAAVRDQIVSTYERNSGLHFVGWNTCLNDKYSQGIRIKVIRGQPQSAIGTSGMGIFGNVQLNFTYEDGPGGWDPSCRTTYGLESCVRWTAAHEFGHALGAEHEQIRPDTPIDCIQYLKNQNAKPEVYTDDGANKTAGPANWEWDWRSIMNVCNNRGVVVDGHDYTAEYNLDFYNRGNLSPIDLQNFQALYGANKLSSRYTTGFGRSTGGISFSLVNTTRANPYATPDLFQIQWTGGTESGNIQIRKVTGASNYSTFAINTGANLGINNNRAYEFGYTMAHIDNDDAPEMVFFARDYSANRLNMYALSGASSWQTFSLIRQLPLEAGNNYKFTFGDYDGDGYQDLFSMRMVSSTSLEITVFKGPTFSNSIARSYVPFTPQDEQRCRYVAGNFYNHRTAAKGLDLVCLHMDPTQTSTPMNIFSWAARESNLQNPYTSSAVVAFPSQLTNVDGRFAAFGLRMTSDPTQGQFPGDGLHIGFIDPQGQSNRTELSYIDASLYF